METTRTRATELLPSVLLTLLSMIQALALELFWSRLRESSQAWQPGWSGLIGALQLAVLLLVLLQVWLFYANLVMRFRWLPTLQDSTVPFAIGLMEFMLIDLSGPERLGTWFGVMAVGFVGFSWSSHDIFRRARTDPANREFFARVAPVSRRDLALALGTFAGLGLLGLLLHWTGDRRWLALTALLAAAGVLIHQLALTRHYWRLSLEEMGAAADPRPAKRVAGGSDDPV